MMGSVVLAVVACCATLYAQSSGSVVFRPEIPKTWDDGAIKKLEIPLADPVGSPTHVSADYYYKIPVRPIYKSYAVLAPDHEPPAYIGGLIQQEPVIVWDDKGHAPPLETEADWIRAGEIVFDAAVVYDGITNAADVREPDWYSKTGVLLTKYGVMPFYRYVIRQKGKVELGRLACSSCHTRVMPDRTTLKVHKATSLLMRLEITLSVQGASNLTKSAPLKRACLLRPGCHRTQMRGLTV